MAHTCSLGNVVASDVELLREAGQAGVVLLRPLPLPQDLVIAPQPGSRHRQPPHRVGLQPLRSPPHTSPPPPHITLQVGRILDHVKIHKFESLLAHVGNYQFNPLVDLVESYHFKRDASSAPGQNVTYSKLKAVVAASQHLGTRGEAGSSTTAAHARIHMARTELFSD